MKNAKRLAFSTIGISALVACNASGSREIFDASAPPGVEAAPTTMKEPRVRFVAAGISAVSSSREMLDAALAVDASLARVAGGSDPDAGQPTAVPSPTAPAIQPIAGSSAALDIAGCIRLTTACIVPNPQIDSCIGKIARCPSPSTTPPTQAPHCCPAICLDNYASNRRAGDPPAAALSRMYESQCR